MQKALMRDSLLVIMADKGSTPSDA